MFKCGVAVLHSSKGASGEILCLNSIATDHKSLSLKNFASALLCGGGEGGKEGGRESLRTPLPSQSDDSKGGQRVGLSQEWCGAPLQDWEQRAPHPHPLSPAQPEELRSFWRGDTIIKEGVEEGRRTKNRKTTLDSAIQTQIFETSESVKKSGELGDFSKLKKLTLSAGADLTLRPDLAPAVPRQ
ncbi:hypothetical protein INR49_006112, partial [Caranx melampygus]